MRRGTGWSELTLLLVSVLVVESPSLGQVVWDGGGSGNDWSVPENWVGDNVPGAVDVAQVSSGSVSIDVTTAVETSYFSNQDGSGALVTLNINSGRVTESSNTFTSRFAGGSNTIINVAGGELHAGPDFDVYGPNSTSPESLTYNITDGGIFGYDRFRYDSVTVNLSGGILDMAGSSGPASLNFANNAALNMSGSGMFVFDIFGNGSNDSLLGSSLVDLTGGLIGFRFASTYTPQVGDTFDFLGTGMNVDETGSNLAQVDMRRRR